MSVCLGLRSRMATRLQWYPSTPWRVGAARPPAAVLYEAVVKTRLDLVHAPCPMDDLHTRVMQRVTVHKNECYCSVIRERIAPQTTGSSAPVLGQSTMSSW